MRTFSKSLFGNDLQRNSVKDMSKLIQLNRGQIAIVSDEDYDFVNQFKWRAFFKGKTCYAYRYVSVNGKGTTQYMHALIMKTPKGMETHHKNSNGLDNRRENLEAMTKSQHRVIIIQARRALGLPAYDWKKKPTGRRKTPPRDLVRESIAPWQGIW